MSCKYCFREICNRGSLVKHENGCLQNPDRVLYRSNFIKYNEDTKSGKSTRWNKGLTKQTHKSIKQGADKISSTLKTKYKRGALLGFVKVEKENPTLHKEISARGGGYRPNSGRSKGAFVLNNRGDSIWVQSSYEVKFAEILNELDIYWVRPEALKYELAGRVRNYYPDFYLPDYNLYFDPKNDFLIVKDREKINEVLKFNNIEIIVVSKENLTKEFIWGCISSA